MACGKKEYTVSFIIDNSERNHYPFEYVDIIETETPRGKFHKFFRLSGRRTKKNTIGQLRTKAITCLQQAY